MAYYHLLQANLRTVTIDGGRRVSQICPEKIIVEYFNCFLNIAIIFAQLYLGKQSKGHIFFSTQVANFDPVFAIDICRPCLPAVIQVVLVRLH